MAETHGIEGRVRRVFETYRTGDQEGFVALLHEEFRFTSPYDDALDQAAFLQRCWPSNHLLTDHDLKMVLTTGDEALVLYELGLKGTGTFRNVERFRFESGLLKEIEVFFGDPPSGFPRWTSSEIENTSNTIQRIYGQIACSHLPVSEGWFESLFGREADERPMDGLVEWHHRGSAGLQLYENGDNAGHCTVTLIVGDVRAERDRLACAELNPGPVELATATTLVRLNDPDGNLVVLAQPGLA